MSLNPLGEKFQSFPLYEEAIKDFEALPCVTKKANGYLVADEKELTRIWVHMRFIKSFDFSDLGV